MIQLLSLMLKTPTPLPIVVNYNILGISNIRGWWGGLILGGGDYQYYGPRFLVYNPHSMLQGTST